MGFFMELFEQAFFVRSLNITFLVLIPKGVKRIPKISGLSVSWEDFTRY